MKKTIAVILAMLLCVLTVSAFAQTVTVEELGCTITVPDDFEAMELYEEEIEDGMLYLWENDSVSLAIYVDEVEAGMTNETLMEALKEDGETMVGTTTIGEDEMVYVYGTETDGEETYAYVEYFLLCEDDLVVVFSFNYTNGDNAAAQVTADIMNSIAWN